MNYTETDVDWLLHQQKNKQKTRKRLCYISTQMLLTLIFTGVEIGINGACMGRKPFLQVNVFCLYTFAIIITAIEILIECFKINKTQKAPYRSRYFSRKFLYIYQFFVCLTTVNLIIHTSSQIYYPIFEFYQECFYLHEKITDISLFATVKVMFIDLFIFIELCIFYMLQQIFCKNLQVLKNPKKLSEQSIYSARENDIVVKHLSINTEPLHKQ